MTQPSTSLRIFEALSQAAMAIDFRRWSLLELSGEDRAEWLQGQATNDLRTLNPGSAKQFCMCTSTGRMVAAVDSWALEDRILLSCESQEVPAVLKRVDELVILEDVLIKDVSDQYRFLSVQGGASSETLCELIDLGDSAAVEKEGVRVLKSDRSGFGGWDVWSPIAHPASVGLSAIERMTELDYEAVRIRAGIPKSGTDYTDRTLPPELGPAFEGRHVSYSKGCYTGQEVLMRIHSRGHTNKELVGILSPVTLIAGEPVVDDEGKECGKVSSATVSPDLGPIGLATLRNEVVRGERKLFTTILGEIIPIQAHGLPFSPP